MQYLQYQLHVSASTLVITRFALTYQETIQSLPPPDPQYIIQIVSSLDKLNANLIMASVEAETCS